MAARPQLPGRTEVGITTSLFCRKTHHRASAEGPADMLSSQHNSRSVFSPLTRCRQSWRGNRIALVNPGVATGLFLSILAWQQDCPCQLWRGNSFPQSCADNRNAPVHHEQLGLGTVLPRAQACDGVGPAVELPGLGHVVDADDEGQAARRVRLAAPCERPGRGPLSYRSSSCCGRGKCKEGQRRCTGAPGRAERVDRPARPGAARSRCRVAAGGAARCSVPAAAAVRRSPTFPRSCCAAGRTRRRPGARHGLSARPAEGARSRSACPPCAPPGAARSAGRPGLASSSSGAGLRRARRRRRRAPPGPGAGRRGSTPAFQNRRRESEARRRPPAAGPGEELTTLCFQSTSAAYQPFGLSLLKTLGAQCCTALRPQTRRPDCPENSVSVLLCSRTLTENTGSASVHTDALTDSPPGFPASNLASNAKERHGEDQAVSYDRVQQQAAL